MLELSLTDLNFEKDIGANSLSLKVGPISIVIDAGLDPKRVGNSALPNFDLLEKNSVDAIILTHCHLDHVGSLPVLCSKQKRAQILLSYPASVIAPTMLENSHTVMCRQKEEKDVKEYPLYEKHDIDGVIKRFRPIKFGKTYRIEKEGAAVDLSFYPAGHIVGASSVLIKFDGRTMFITGDTLFSDQHSLKGAKFPDEDIDVVLLETTRGNTKRTATRESEESRLLKTIAETVDRGGVCLIPAFALGRIQELIQLFYNAKRMNKLPDCPIFCSGLGMSLVSTFGDLSKKSDIVTFNRRAIGELKIRSLGRKKITPGANIAKPAIYLLSSGMLVEHTPSYKIATCILHDSKNSVCFVGYCDPDTPGGKLLNTKPEEEFLFEAINFTTPLRSSVHRFDLSGHADRDELYKFAVDRNAKKVILGHGDEDARKWFIDQFAKNNGTVETLDPSVGKMYKI